MSPFLAAQADDPFDPAPMLIHADWLEEHGDATGAAVLRGLVEGGMPSLHALALEVAHCSVTFLSDQFGYRGLDGSLSDCGGPVGGKTGIGSGDRYGPSYFGDKDGNARGVGHGDVYGYMYVDGEGEGGGDFEGDRDG